MPNLKPMIVGQKETFHVKVYAQDNTQTPSQVVDNTTPLIVTSSFPTICTVAPHPTDNRAFIVTAVSAAIGTLIVNESPALPSPVTLNVVISPASQPDNRRCDFLSADDPV